VNNVVFLIKFVT